MPIVFSRYTTAIFIRERKVEEQLPCDLGLKFCHAVDDVVVPIEYRRLIKRAMKQIQIVGDLLLHFGTYRNAVVVVREESWVGEVGPIVNEGGTYGIVTE